LVEERKKRGSSSMNFPAEGEREKERENEKKGERPFITCQGKERKKGKKGNRRTWMASFSAKA